MTTFYTSCIGRRPDGGFVQLTYFEKLIRDLKDNNYEHDASIQFSEIPSPLAAEEPRCQKPLNYYVIDFNNEEHVRSAARCLFSDDHAVDFRSAEILPLIGKVLSVCHQVYQSERRTGDQSRCLNTLFLEPLLEKQKPSYMFLIEGFHQRELLPTNDMRWIPGERAPSPFERVPSPS